jgi:hypothetical protein
MSDARKKPCCICRRWFRPRVLACVSELVEIRIVRWLAGEKSKSNGESVIRIISSHIGFWIAGTPIVRLNRYACRDP